MGFELKVYLRIGCLNLYYILFSYFATLRLCMTLVSSYIHLKTTLGNLKCMYVPIMPLLYHPFTPFEQCQGIQIGELFCVILVVL